MRETLVMRERNEGFTKSTAAAEIQSKIFELLSTLWISTG